MVLPVSLMGFFWAGRNFVSHSDVKDFINRDSFVLSMKSLSG